MVPLLLRLLTARQLSGGLVFALVCAALAVAGGTEAATLTVTSTADSGAGSLRAAIAAAGNGDTIQFDPALNGQTINLTTGELAINQSITISGPGANLLAVSRSSGAASFRIFHIMSGHTILMDGLTITGGSMVAGTESGGGILNEGTLSLANSAVRSNTAYTSGGISNTGSMTITNSIVSFNSTPWFGGGISSSGILTIVNSVVSSNYAGHGGTTPSGKGGGIYVNGGSLELIQSTVSGNTSVIEGGGIQSDGGTITITDSTVANNLATVGGGIEALGTATVDIRSSAISGNNANSRGGGISTSSGQFSISNSSVSNNSAGNFGNTQGGGIATGGGPATIENCTVSGNTATQGGVSLYVTSALEIGNTIMNASGSGANIFHSGSNTFTSLGYNISSDDGGGFLSGPGDQINTNSLLGPLQDNGGPTFTHALLPGSPAIDAGDPNFTPPPSTDQRGYARVYNGRIDIGSVEMQPVPTPTPTITPTATPTATATATIAPTVTPTPTPTPTPSPRPVPCDLIEGFENITTLAPSGWVRANLSQPLGSTGWTQGNSSFGGFGYFPPQSGAPLSYIAANFLNGSEQATISNWLLTPAVTLQNGAKLSFWTRTGTSPLFPDRLQVRMSTNGTSQNVGTTPTDVGDFTTLLLDINPTYTTSGYPNGWTNFVVTLSGLGGPVTGRLAFRYFVENGGPSGLNSDVIGIDSVAYGCNGTPPTPTPSPTVVPTPTPGTPTSSVTGTILNCSSPRPNVRLNVTGVVTGSKLSNGSGIYTFSFLPWARDFTVTPAKAALAPGSTGITGVDAVAVQRHFLNLGTPLSGCRLTAADVTGNSLVDGVDAVAIQRFFLGFTSGIANTGKYQFNPGSRSYTGNGSNWTDQNYDMVLFGDVVAPFAE